MTDLQIVPYSTSDFNYTLPPELIAQHPAPSRDASDMLVLQRETGDVSHRSVRDFADLLNHGDVVVRNTSRVLKARMFGARENGREAEVLLVHPDSNNTWLAMVHPGGKLKKGRKIFFEEGIELSIVDVVGGGLRKLALKGTDWSDLMDRFGQVPLPPYIERKPEEDDLERYQTIFAKEEGSVAAPTAGLHFTDSLLKDIEDRGAVFADILLHVGPGTFKPVQTEDPAQHVMHAEWYRISKESADVVNSALEAGKRIWAIGTTATRVLETVGKTGTVIPGEGWTDLFISPPFDFRIVGGIFTNFHLPSSTLLMLVCAFGGWENVMGAYNTAVERGYRFYSYGDAMAVF